MIRRLAGPALLLAVVACGAKLLTITIEDQAETTIEEGTLLEDAIGDLGFGDLLNVDIVDAQELENQGVEPGDIREVYLTDFVLTATDPPDADLSFLERVDIVVSSPGLPERVIATASDFPAGLASVDFELEDVDLTDYVVAESMTLTTDASGRRPGDDTTVRADFAIDVGVTGRGACNQAGRAQQIGHRQEPPGEAYSPLGGSCL